MRRKKRKAASGPAYSEAPSSEMAPGYSGHPQTAYAEMSAKERPPHEMAGSQAYVKQDHPRGMYAPAHPHQQEPAELDTLR